MSDDIYAPDYVKGVFDRCSDRYIMFSWLCSFGFTERWRRQCVAMLPEPAGPAGYDLMAGTGEVWPHLLKRFPWIDQITAVDISSGMHRRAIDRLLHLKTVLPLMERFLLRGAQDFAKIGTYSTNFGDSRAFAEMLRAAHLEVGFHRYFFGCATGVSGRKPS
ncbi:MAG: class I SAM-dependent methyltransferase [Pseudomonadota bacterium]